MKRLSRSNPYVLTSGDLEALLSAVSPSMEEDIANGLGISVGEWRLLSPSKRAACLVDNQLRGILAANVAVALKAQADLRDMGLTQSIRSTERDTVISELIAAKEEDVA